LGLSAIFAEKAYCLDLLGLTYLPFSDMNNGQCRQPTEGIKIRRKTLFRLCQSLLVLALLFPQIVHASSLESKREEAKRVKNQVDALGQSLYKVTDQYNSALSKLERLRAEIAKTESELAAAQQELEKDQKILNGRVKNIYRGGNVQFLEVVLGSKDLHEFLLRAELMTKIGKRDANLLSQIKAKKKEIEAKKEQLVAARAQQQSTVAELKNQQNEIAANLGKQKQLLSGVEGEVAALEREEREARARAEAEQQRKRLASRTPSSGSSSSGGSSVARISGFVFPVAGPHSFSNDWHAARVGHLHQGCDIMAAQGTPAVACVSGSVRTSEGGRQGHAIWLHGDDGNSYFYAHLSGYAVTGGHVDAGQTFGYVGNTGNASGGAPHVHFEVHPGGGGAVNPYPILCSAN